IQTIKAGVLYNRHIIVVTLDDGLSDIQTYPLPQVLSALKYAPTVALSDPDWHDRLRADALNIPIEVTLYPIPPEDDAWASDLQAQVRSRAVVDEVAMQAETLLAQAIDHLAHCRF
ncbi:MAG TPA: hypothetical protein PLZ51_24350, partial [Aggregatilineales bacterium]|nr:hypothetical protein [Aggregatilineales bacterium]